MEFLTYIIKKSTNPFFIILGSLESPYSGLYRRKKSLLIESLDSGYLHLKL
ncbi:hypothetical protein RhiirC2_763380, partial [Rhizophagus irregularis]